MATIEIKVPDIGDFSDVSVIELLVKAGDRIRAEQSLITVESDKAAMEIPSSHSGIVNEMKVALGDKLRQGSLILLLDVAEVTVAAEVAEVAEVAVEVIVDSMPKQAVAPVQLASTAINPIADQMTVDLPHASPSVRKFARELGIPLNEVKGTGPKRPHYRCRCSYVHPIGDGRHSANNLRCCRHQRRGRSGANPLAPSGLCQIGPHRTQIVIAHQKNQRCQFAAQRSADSGRHPA